MSKTNPTDPANPSADPRATIKLIVVVLLAMLGGGFTMKGVRDDAEERCGKVERELAEIRTRLDALDGGGAGADTATPVATTESASEGTDPERTSGTRSNSTGAVAEPQEGSTG